MNMFPIERNKYSACNYNKCKKKNLIFVCSYCSNLPNLNVVLSSRCFQSYTASSGILYLEIPSQIPEDSAQRP